MAADEFPATQVESWARQEVAAISSAGLGGSGGSSGNDLPYILLGVAVVVLFVAAFVVVRRRRAVPAFAVADQTFQRLPETTYTQPTAVSVTRSSPPPPSFQVGVSPPPFNIAGVAAPTITPGWHPVDGDPTKVAYWDGEKWAAYRQWDGLQWVDSTAVSQPTPN
jgi:hypothetical protein